MSIIRFFDNGNSSYMDIDDAYSLWSQLAHENKRKVAR